MFLRAYPSHTIADIYAMSWYCFQLFLRLTMNGGAEYVPLRNAADEATDRITQLAAWQAKRDAKRQSS